MSADRTAERDVRIHLKVSVDGRDSVAPGHSAAAHYDRPRLDWRRGLPVLRSDTVLLRELRQSDAPALMAYVANPAVLEYVAGAPRSLEGFRRFIRWCRAQRRAGTYLTFGVVPTNQPTVAGLLQIWPIEHDFSTAEWGFVIGQPFWGTGVFNRAAELLLDFAFQTLGVVRLEARAVEADRRCNGVLRKLGATAEGRLRSSFRSNHVVLDHVMWSILAPEWPLERSGGTRAIEP